MALGDWQIIATVIIGFASPFVAARFAVSQVGRELDNARLDELRGVLDDTVSALSRAGGLLGDAATAVGKHQEAPDMQAEAEGLLDVLWRLQLRIGEDPVARHVEDAYRAFQRARMGFAEWGDADARRETRDGRRQFTDAYRALIEDARDLVGPSRQALKRIRRSIPRSNISESDRPDST
jgi:hypothetical protein